MLLLVVAAIACEDNGTSMEDPTDPGPTEPNPTEPNDDPIFAACGAIFNPEGPSAYLALVSSRESGTTVDVQNTIEQRT